MSKDETSTTTRIEPDAGLRRAGVTEEPDTDAEAHAWRIKATDDPGIEPEDAARPGKVTEDPEDDTEGHAVRRP